MNVDELLEAKYRRWNRHFKILKDAISAMASKLSKEKGMKSIKIMHVCGTHEHTVTYYGLRSVVPKSLNLIAGPGCPVCVTPGAPIDDLSRIAVEGEATIYTYGDVYRLPGIRSSLSTARSMGGDVRVVYSFFDAVRDARESGVREAIFVGVGFETTAPTVASLIIEGKVPGNLKILSLYRLTAPGLNEALNHHYKAETPIHGVIPPGHVSTIIGVRSWSYLSDRYKLPAVVAGFEPLDYLLAVAEILRQILNGESKLVNEYRRVARWEGNVRAWRRTLEVFEPVDGYWRGIGVLRDSSLAFKDKYKAYDAASEYGVRLSSRDDLPPGCRCAEITLGLATPSQCPHFLRSCRPSRPIGPCMVSSEGTCSVWARFGGVNTIDKILKDLGLSP